MPFLADLKTLINTHNIESRSNTPDYILANYIDLCLEAWDKATEQRDEYNRKKTNPEPKTKTNVILAIANDKETLPMMSNFLSGKGATLVDKNQILHRGVTLYCIMWEGFVNLEDDPDSIIVFSSDLRDEGFWESLEACYSTVPVYRIHSKANHAAMTLDIIENTVVAS